MVASKAHPRRAQLPKRREPSNSLKKHNSSIRASRCNLHLDTRVGCIAAAAEAVDLLQQAVHRNQCYTCHCRTLGHNSDRSFGRNPDCSSDRNSGLQGARARKRDPGAAVLWFPVALSAVRVAVVQAPVAAAPRLGLELVGYRMRD